MHHDARTSERRLVELDVSFGVPWHSGVATYTAAMAQELLKADDLHLVLRTGRDPVDPRLAGIPQRKLRAIDRFIVQPGAVRVIPHQVRIPPLIGTALVTVHDVIHLGTWTPIHKRLAQRVLLTMFKLSRVGIITVSHATRARLLALGFSPERLVLRQSSLPQRPHKDVVPPAPQCGGGGFVYVGNLRSHKGVDYLAAAHALLLQRIDTPLLHLVTSGPSSVRIGELGAHYPDHLRTRLCVHASADDAERDGLLSSAVAYVAPSIDEGYGYGIDEATALGTPVIATAIPAHIENGAGRDVVFVPAADPRALADAMHEALTGAMDRKARQSYQLVGLRERADLADIVRAAGRARDD